jgi:Spy/CpxP family protein refolding chaperone
MERPAGFLLANGALGTHAAAPATKGASLMRTLPTTFAALLLAVPVLAAPGAPGFRGGPGHGPEGRHVQVAELLDLDATQRAAFEQMRADGLAAAKPKFEQMRALHDEMRALLDSGSTDAAAIGAKMIAAHQLRNELRAERAAAEAEFVKLLSDEQRFAFAALKQARQSMRERGRGPGFGPGGFGPRHDGADLDFD